MAAIQSSYESASDGPSFKNNSDRFRSFESASSFKTEGQESRLNSINEKRTSVCSDKFNRSEVSKSPAAAPKKFNPKNLNNFDEQNSEGFVQVERAEESLVRELATKLLVDNKGEEIFISAADTTGASNETRRRVARGESETSEANKQRQTAIADGSANGDKSVVGRRELSLLDELLEGKKSWLEHKTVIVEIRNGQRIETSETLERDRSNFRRGFSGNTTRQAAKEEISSSNQEPTTRTAPKQIPQLDRADQVEKSESFSDSLNNLQVSESNNENSDTLADKSSLANKPSSGNEEEVEATFGVSQEEINKGREFKKEGSKFKKGDTNSSEEAKRVETKGTRPPTFGSTPSRLSRIPNFNHYLGRLTGTKKTYQEELRRADSNSSQQSSQSRASSSSASSSPSTATSKIPTLLAKGGYARPVNLNQGRPMSIRTSNFGSQSNTQPVTKQSSFGRQRRQQSSSLLNLNQIGGSRSGGVGSAATAAAGAATGATDTKQQHGNHRSSLYSLNSPTSPVESHYQRPTFSTMMRRQNVANYQGGTLTRTARQQYAPGQGRPNSAAANYLYPGRQYRSPSASSLYHGNSGGSAGLGSPYYYGREAQQQLIDPDCPVHGRYSPLGASMSKSAQHLAQTAFEAPDLLYDPYQPPPAVYYSNVLPPVDRRLGSLYSPTSPTSRSNKINALGGAYYNNSSRFSIYHSPTMPGGEGLRSSLAPPNEQLRRIIGYQPPTKPVHLHPQWAYSRPFIHLQSRSSILRSPDDASPISPIDGEPEEIKPRFEAYNQLHDSQAIRAIDFHPSGEVYAIGSNSRALRICAYPADHELRHFSLDSHVTSSPRILFKFLQVHRGSIYCVSFNNSGQLLATGSNDQTVHIVKYNSTTHSPDGDEFRLTMHDGTVRDLRFIDDQTNSSSLLLSAGGGDNKIYVTDCDTITPYQSMAGHTQMVMSLDHWAGAAFVSGSYDRTIRFWDLRTRNCTSIISAPSSLHSSATGASKYSYGGPGAPVCSVKIDPTGRLLVSGHSDSTCMLYDIRGARIIQAFKPNTDEIRTVSFSPKSYYLLTGGYDGRIVLTDLQGDLTQPLPSVCVAENDDKIVQSKWHPTDFTFVTTSADKTATLWALPEGD